MRKLALLVFLLSLPAFPQSYSGQSAGDIFIVSPYRACFGPDNGKNACFSQGHFSNQIFVNGALDYQLTTYNVANLPSAALNGSRIYLVNDGNSTSDCSVGGGTNYVLCISNGTTWQGTGSGGGGGGLTPPTCGDASHALWFLGGNYQCGAITGSASAGSPTNSLQYNNASAIAGVPATKVTIGTGSAEIDVPRLSNVRHVIPSDNWLVSGVAVTLTAGSPATITLTPCPIGVDTSALANMGSPAGAYQVYISNDANPEAVYVSGGTCTNGAASGTIIFTPFFSHTSAAYNIGSASSGIQEAINDGCGTLNTARPRCQVILPPAGNYNGSTYTYPLPVYGTIYFHAFNSVLSGYGSVLQCFGRSWCIQVGNQTTSVGAIQNNTIAGISFEAMQNYGIANISSTQRTSGTVTITTAAPHGFRTGDCVTQNYTDDTRYWGDVPQITVTDATHYTYTRSGAADIALQTTPGYVHLCYDAIMDNAQSTHFIDNTYGALGMTQTFMHFFDLWDDENAVIDHYSGSNAYTMGYVIFSGGQSNLPNTSTNLAPVITWRDSTLTNEWGAWVSNSNGFYSKNNVIQNAAVQFFISNQTGNFQGAFIENLYSESAAGANTSGPFANLGVAGMIAGPVSGFYHLKGGQAFSGVFPTVGSSGSNYRAFYVVAHDITAGTVSAPALCSFSQQSSLGAITIICPRISNVAHTITYDLLMTPASSNNVAGLVFPSTGNCTGGSNNVCGSVITGQAQGAGFIQSFSVNTSTNTTAYTVAQATFKPAPIFWPGTVVLNNNYIVSDIDMPGIVNFNGYGPDLFTPNCSSGGQNNLGGYTECTTTIPAPNNSNTNNVALLLPENGVTGGVTGFVKGRINFTSSGYQGFSAHHFITLLDSNPDKTHGTQGYRPTADTNDVYIGTDVTGAQSAATAGQLSFGAPVAISNYIANTGDNASWKERLTSSLKEFNIPVQLDSTLQVASTFNLQSLSPATLTDGATITWAIGSTSMANAQVTLGGARTLNITGMLAGGNYTLKIIQDGTGGRTLTLGTGCTHKVANGGGGVISLSPGAGAVDILAIYYDGAICWDTLGKNFN